MNYSILKSIVLGLATAGLLLFGLFMPANVPEPARADPGRLFVTTTGTGSTCTQAQPCGLQTGLTQAIDGDTIYVAGGTYIGTGSDVILLTKSIILHGGWDGTATEPLVRDPDAYPTILDGENVRRVVYVYANTSPALNGLRLTNGSTSGDGGGLFANQAQPTVINCQISNNTARYSGGGVYLNNSADARLTGNTIYSNTASTFLGGGVYLRNSDNASLMNSSVYSNTAQTGGGGVYLDNSNDAALVANDIFTNTTNTYGGGIFVAGGNGVRLARNHVVNNEANSQGGGIHINNSLSATLTSNIIDNNLSRGSGGGVSILNKSNGALLDGNVVSKNGAGGEGGGVFLHTIANASLVNNIVAENRLTGLGSSGAGIYAYAASADLLHSTIVRNSGGSGQGIHLQSEAAVWMTNTILVSHTIGIEAGANTTATLVATFWGDEVWANLDDTAGSGSIFTGTVNIRGDPAFVDPNAGDYHIGPASAALDQGVDAGVKSDVDHEPRPYLGPDLGADEYWPAGVLNHIYLPLVVK